MGSGDTKHDDTQGSSATRAGDAEVRADTQLHTTSLEFQCACAVGGAAPEGAGAVQHEAVADADTSDCHSRRARRVAGCSSTRDEGGETREGEAE